MDLDRINADVAEEMRWFLLSPSLLLPNVRNIVFSLMEDALFHEEGSPEIRADLISILGVVTATVARLDAAETRISMNDVEKIEVTRREISASHTVVAFTSGVWVCSCGHVG